MPLRNLMLVLWGIYGIAIITIINGWIGKDWNLGITDYITLILMIFNGTVIAFANWKLYHKWRNSRAIRS